MLHKENYLIDAAHSELCCVFTEVSWNQFTPMIRTNLEIPSNAQVPWGYSTGMGELVIEHFCSATEIGPGCPSSVKPRLVNDMSIGEMSPM